jgi:branched-subunit amino acid transport protein
MPIVTVILVGAVSLAFRLSFTVLADPERLPAALRDRLDVVGPATFGALIAGSLAGAVGTPQLVPAVVGLSAAGLAATRTSQLLAPVLVGVAVTTATTLALLPA